MVSWQCECVAVTLRGLGLFSGSVSGFPVEVKNAFQDEVACLGSHCPPEDPRSDDASVGGVPRAASDPRCPTSQSALLWPWSEGGHGAHFKGLPHGRRMCPALLGGDDKFVPLAQLRLRVSSPQSSVGDVTNRPLPLLAS